MILITKANGPDPRKTITPHLKCTARPATTTLPLRPRPHTTHIDAPHIIEASLYLDRMHGALHEVPQGPAYDVVVNSAILASSDSVTIVQPGNHRRMLVKAADAANTVHY